MLASALRRPAFAAQARPAATPETLPPDRRIPRYTPGPMPLGDSPHLVYRASWLGIPAADAVVELRRDPHNSQFVGEARIRTNRFIDLFYRMRDYVREDFELTSLAPRRIYIRRQEKNSVNEFTVDFDPKTHLISAEKKSAHGEEHRLFLSDNPVGPISGVILALSQPLAIGQSYTFDVFIGRRRYVMALRPVARERLRIAAGVFDTLRIEVAIIWSSDARNNRAARSPTLWVTDDERHLPLRIQSATFIGYVRADLITTPDLAER